MAVFEYTGIESASGKSIKGYRDAESPRALRVALRKDGVLLTSAEEGGEQKQKKTRRGGSPSYVSTSLTR